MKICTDVICTWSIKFTYMTSSGSCVASASAGKLGSMLQRLEDKYEGFELTKLKYFKTFIYKH